MALRPWPAQPATRPKVVAVLGVGRPPLSGPVIDGFRDALRDLGWVEGRNVVYEFRWAEGRPERLPGLARELVALSPDVIWTFFSVAAVAARQATTTIPIVVASSADQLEWAGREPGQTQRQRHRALVAER